MTHLMARYVKVKDISKCASKKKKKKKEDISKCTTEGYSPYQYHCLSSSDFWVYTLFNEIPKNLSMKK